MKKKKILVTGVSGNLGNILKKKIFLKILIFQLIKNWILEKKRN